MKIPMEITFRGMEPSPVLDRVIRDCAAHLEAAHDGVVRCEVVVEIPHRHHRQGRQVHVRIALTVPGGEIVVSHDPGRDEHEDAYVAVRDSFRVARRQLDEYRRRLRDAIA